MPDNNATPFPAETGARPSDAEIAHEKRRKFMRWGLIGLGPLVVLLVGGWFFLTGGRYVSTDDAFVKTDLATISTQVPGQVATVYVSNNQRVTAGQVLFELDPATYVTTLSQAEADLANVQNQIAALRANYREKAAMLQNAVETVAYQKTEYDRQDRLRKGGASSQQQLDQARHNLDVSQRNLDAMQQQMAALQAQLSGDVDTPTEELAQYKAALAKRNDAQISLDRTKVVAPSDGIAANVTVRPGDYVTAGQPVFSVAEIDTLWVEANFKETQLTNVLDGQPATVKVDAYPGVTWKAKVESLSPASGGEFSALPAENSSGNWVKVVQRIPVRIAVLPPNDSSKDKAPQLRAGMSVTVEIDTKPPATQVSADDNGKPQG